MPRGRILYLVSEDWYFCSHRLPMAGAARDAGFEVAVLTRINAHKAEIEANGFRPIPLKLSRGSRNPFSAVGTIADIARTYRRERPDLVHHVNLKMCLLGSAAARLAGRPRVVNALTGLGYLFTSERADTRILRALVLAGLRWLNRLTGGWIIVQNRDDHALAVSQRLAPAAHVVLIPGSGVDTVRFAPAPHRPPQPETGPPQLTYVGRMLADKGLRELAAASRILKARGLNVRVVLVGPVDAENPQSLGEDELRAWMAAGLVDWRGRQSDIPVVWAESTLAVLPSYREGMPKSLLEAAACGVPAIATDVPGCRELVVHGETGLLVPPRNAEALADAIQRLLADPARLAAMGAAARARVETHFSADIIATQTTRLYARVLAGA